MFYTSISSAFLCVSMCENNVWYDNLSSSSGPFYQYGLTLIPAWTSNYIPYNVWDETTYPFLNFNGATVEV